MTPTRSPRAPRLPALLLVACGGGGEAGPHDHAHDACLDEPRAEAFVAAMAKTGAAGVTVTLAAADPAPPDVGLNTWTLAIATADGPAAGATVRVTPFMPDHGHGAADADGDVGDLLEFPATEGEGGHLVGPMNLHMPGYWENAVDVELSDGTADRVSFDFCLEG